MSDAWLRPLSPLHFFVVLWSRQTRLALDRGQYTSKGSLPTTRWLGSYPGTLLQGHCITIIWCALLVRVLSQCGFYVPLLEPSSLGTLLVRVLSQYPVKVRRLSVSLGGWGSNGVYCYHVIVPYIKFQDGSVGGSLWQVRQDKEISMRMCRKRISHGGQVTEVDKLL